MNDWHGTSTTTPLDPSLFNPAMAANLGGMNAYNDQLSDVQLGTPTLIPNQSWQKSSYGRYPPQFG
jgi:hypothetical protein